MKQRKKCQCLGRRILALFVAAVLVVPGVGLNGAVVAGAVEKETVEQNDTGKSGKGVTNPSEIGNTSSNVRAVFTPSQIEGDYHEYYLKVENGLSESIADWIVQIPLTGVYGSENWAAAGWAKVQAYYTSEYLYIAPAGGAVLSAGASFGSTSDGADGAGGAYKFNYKGSSNINAGSAVVYYKTGSSSTGAFDGVVDNASVDSGSGNSGSGGSGGSQTDTTTDLNLDIEYNFAKLLQESLYFYDANMCGEIEDVCAISWRGNCHLDDKKVTYGGKTYDVSGGFHDAGDHVKFGLPQGYSSSVLAMGYYEFGDAYDELGQAGHYQTIMDHFCDYYTRSTIYDGSDVKAFCYQVGDGDADHGYWGAPENQTGSRPAWFADASNPATDEVSVAITTLALHAMNFKDSAKSATYLKTAKDLFAFVKKNNKAVATQGAAGFYPSSDWKDDYASAAIALYKATNDEGYLNEFKQYYTSGNIKTGWVLTWDNMWAVASMLYEDWNTVSQFASYSGNVINGYKIVDGWGSARYNTTLQFLGLSYDQANGKFNTADGSYCAWATGQMKYLLGNNDKKRCFVVGYNENSAKYPHHRAASRSGDANSVREDHYTLLGALVGGPDGNGNYADNQGDYNCNEVALDYNAGMVGAAAGLYLLHKGNSDFNTGLASESELKAIGIDKYYGGTSGSGAGGSGTGGSGSGSGTGTGSGSGTGGSGSGSGTGTGSGSGTGGSGSGSGTGTGSGSGTGGSGSGSGSGSGTGTGSGSGTGGSGSGSGTGTGSGSGTGGSGSGSGTGIGSGSGTGGSGTGIGTGTGTGSGTGIGATNPKVTFVPALTTTNVMLKKGGSYKLSTNSGNVRITKVAYANKKAKKIVKVNKKGKIKGKKNGKAKLKVTFSYGGKTYTKAVTVKVQKNPVKVLNKTVLSVKLKRKGKCVLVNPTNMLSAKGIKFTSSKKKVAAVNKKGVVTGKKKGKAKITAVMGGKTYTVNVKVK